jgi:hypothetical protein
MPPKAKPTEWNGIRFRSKSEAKFAAFLTAQGFSWIYEPLLSHFDIQWKDQREEWRPDFVIIHARDNVPVFNVVEYKPRRPTKTYMDELAKSYVASTCSHNLIQFTLDIVVGGMGYEPAESTECDTRCEWSEWQPGWWGWSPEQVDDKVRAATDHIRFDLQGG